MAALLAVVLVVLLYGLVSGKVERSLLTGPIVFVGAGLGLGAAGATSLDVHLDAGAVGLLAEATLVLVLFTDAIRIDLSRLRTNALVPARMLALGLPLTVAAGTVLARAVLPDLGWVGAFALAAVLTPTDAALGQVVVTDGRLPVRVRQAVNVESGLNDGLALPVVTVAAAVLAGEAAGGDPGEWARLAFGLVGLGILAGVVVGFGGGRTLDRAVRAGWVTGVFRQLVTLSIGVAAFAVAETIGGNGFVAAFVAGLAFGHAARDQCEGAYDFAEDEGVLLSLLTFLAFGIVASETIFDVPDPSVVVFAVLSLTVARMVPIALSLIGSGLALPTVAFLGWFGPRGLASILFGVLVLEEQGVPLASRVFEVVTWTVVLSVVAHGVTARPFVGWYAGWSGRMDDEAPEMQPAAEMPVRRSG